jgi:hypothetical protein
MLEISPSVRAVVLSPQRDAIFPDLCQDRRKLTGSSIATMKQEADIPPPINDEDERQACR